MSSGQTTAFFDELARREYDPLLANALGTARFEVLDGERRERWFVTIDKGRITVSRKNTRAGTTIQADRKTFDKAAAGTLNVMAAVLRGEIVISGDPRFLVRLQRLIPRPSGGP
jgi:alkyl sulfatase BDS1-like metallo-beta-lactamase superfamily hydrolase